MVKPSDLISYASDPAFTLDTNMCVLGWNDDAQKLLGYSESEARGQKCGQILQAFYQTGEPLCSVLCEGRACITNGKKWGINTCLLRHKNGEMVTAGISSLVLPADAREDAGDQAIAVIFLREASSAKIELQHDVPLRVFSLGPFALAHTGNGLNVDNWKRKQAVTVLKCLISQLDKPVHRERLMEWLWPNSDPASAWSRLKVTVSYLRKELARGGVGTDVIETVGQSYLLRRSSVWVDSDVFCTLVSEGWDLLKAGDLANAQVSFEQAESLYRGDFFEDEPYAEWCTVERERLREIYLELLAGLVKCYMEAGHLMTASRVCRQALSSDPCRENFIRSLIECLVSLERCDWARAHFISWRRSLDEEYGLQPTSETLKVYHDLVGDDKTEFRETA